MTGRVNLDELANEAIAQSPGLDDLKPVVVKELIHYEIMSALDHAGYLQKLTFHGGTALRLCYGATRLSEDLDFTGGPNFTRDDVDGISAAVSAHLTERYGLEVTVKEPKPRKDTGKPVEVDTWQINVITDPGQSHIPRQKIKIDIATMVAQTKSAQPIQRNYSVLPSGLGDLLVPTMSKEEILANKLVSLPASARQQNIRYRDIWDIAWLTQNGATVNKNWVSQRAEEFKIDDFLERLDLMQEALFDHVTNGKFRQEMSRFIPRDAIARTFNSADFIPYVVNIVGDRLTEAKEAVARPGASRTKDAGPTL